MKAAKKANNSRSNGLDKKFQKVEQTPAGFALYVAIHDFIEFVEADKALSREISHRNKINKELDIPAKYAFLKQVYQGLEDIGSDTAGDLGHDRYSAIRDLSRIKNNDLSENNAFWKKREVYRKLTGVVYKRLSEPEVAVSTLA
jgi:hypothetical protein